MTDDRSERLRKRRKQSTESVGRQGQTDTDEAPRPVNQPDSVDSPGSSRDGAGTSESGGETTVSIKEEQVGTYMYLPESQTKELRRLYNILKAEYEFEYDDEFEKNRHFYPLVIQYGLDRLDGLDASEIRDHIEEIT